jgi:hypothetical protein
VSEGTALTNETELLAWAVLRAANTTQARGATVRRVVPRAPERAPEVAHDFDIEFPEERIVEAEKWLVERGYLATANVGLTWGTYTITPAGLDWLRGAMPEPLEGAQKATEDASPVPGGPLRAARTLLRPLSASLGGGGCSGPSG